MWLLFKLLLCQARRHLARLGRFQPSTIDNWVARRMRCVCDEKSYRFSSLALDLLQKNQKNYTIQSKCITENPTTSNMKKIKRSFLPCIPFYIGSSGVKIIFKLNWKMVERWYKFPYSNWKIVAIFHFETNLGPHSNGQAFCQKKVEKCHRRFSVK